jgi:hypothetical protein
MGEMTKHPVLRVCPSVLARLKCAPKIVACQVVAMLVSYTLVLLGYGVFRSNIFFLASPSIVFVSVGVALYCVMPPKSELPWLVLRWLAVVISYMVATLVFNAMFYADGVTDLEVTLQVCVFFPIIREVS